MSKEGDYYSSGGEPPRGNDLEKRVEHLEKALPDIRDRLTRLEVKIDSIEKHGATKNDIAQMEIRISRWMYGLVFGVIVLIIRSFL